MVEVREYQGLTEIRYEINFEFKALKKFNKHAKRHELEFAMMNQLLLEVNNLTEICLKLKIDNNMQNYILRFMEELIIHGALKNREQYNNLKPDLERTFPSLIHQID